MEKVFLLGNPRSGTSLLRIMLNCHPKITAPPECGFLQWRYSKYKYWSKEDINLRNLNSFLDDLFASKKFETWNLNRNEVKQFLIKEHPASYSELTSRIYEFWGLCYGHKAPQVIIDKNNYYIHHLDEISQIWPEANYIHLIRDGRDVACSYKSLEELDTTSPYKPQLPTNIENIAKDWTQNNLKIINFLQALEKDRSQSIKFEDLIRQPKDELFQLCNFLEVDFSEKMLSYDKSNKENYIEPKETIDWKKKTLEKPDPRKVGRYKKDLSNNDISKFEAIANDVLQTFNYR